MTAAKPKTPDDPICPHCLTEFTPPDESGVHTCGACGFDVVIDLTDGLAVFKPHDPGAPDGLSASLGTLETP